MPCILLRWGWSCCCCGCWNVQVIDWCQILVHQLPSGVKFGTSLFHCVYLSLIQRYLGTIMKFGPFASKEYCAGVSGVLERLMTHFLVVSVESIHIWPELVQVWLGTTEGAQVVLGEGVEAMGAARAVELPLVLDMVLELLVGRFKCLLKEPWLELILLRFEEPLVKLWWYPYFWKYKWSI